MCTIMTLILVSIYNYYSADVFLKYILVTRDPLSDNRFQTLRRLFIEYTTQGGFINKEYSSRLNKTGRI